MVKKSLLIASLAVMSEIVFGMFPNNPNGNFGNNGNKRSFSQISEINGEEQQSRRIRISSQEGIPVRSEKGLDLLASTAILREQTEAVRRMSLEYMRSLKLFQQQMKKPMYIALKEGNLNTVKILINHGVRVEEAVYTAAQHGHIDIVKYLAEKGFDIEETNFAGRSPLFIAVSNGHRNVVQYLVEKGADVNKKIGEGLLGESSALLEAIQRKRWEITAYLLDNGANINVYFDNFSEQGTPLSNICKTGQIELIKRFLELGADPNLGEKHCALINQVMRGRHHCNVEILKLLLQYGANKEQPDRNGKTALMHAALRGRTDIIELLLKDHLNVNAKDAANRTALIHALYIGGIDIKKGNVRYDIVKMLLDHGADPNVKTSTGLTPLVYAARLGSEDIARLLIERKADLKEAISILEGNEKEKDSIEFLNSLVTKE